MCPCVAGHTSGVFISSCSSNPRSHAPCAYLAAVVSNKTLVAELYIPRSSTPPDPWVGMLTPPPSAYSCSSTKCDHPEGRHCCCTGRSQQCNCNSTASISSSSSNSCSGSRGLGLWGSPVCSSAAHENKAAAAATGVELWLSDSVQLHKPQLEQQGSAAAAAGAGGRGGGRGRRGRRGHSAAAGSSSQTGVTWSDVHKLILECIGERSVCIGLQLYRALTLSRLTCC